MNKRQYDMAFKIDTAKLVAEQGYTVSEASERLGIPIGNITRWVRHFLRSSTGQPRYRTQTGTTDGG